MLRKLVPFVLWLVMGAVILPLFVQNGDDDSLSVTLIEQGISLKLNQNTCPGFFPLKLFKKIKGFATSNRIVLRGKSLCRPPMAEFPVEPHSCDRPLFLVFHALRFYDPA